MRKTIGLIAVLALGLPALAAELDLTPIQVEGVVQPLTVGGEPRTGTHVFENMATNTYYRSFRYGTTGYWREQIADYGVAVGTGPWYADHFHIGIVAQKTGVQTWPISFHYDDGYYPNDTAYPTGNWLATVDVSVNLPSTGGWLIEVTLPPGTFIAFPAPAETRGFQWSYRRHATHLWNEGVLHVNLPTIGTNADNFMEFRNPPNTWGTWWYGGTVISNIYMAIPEPASLLLLGAGLLLVRRR